MVNRDVSLFLLRHQGQIMHASMMADGMTIKLRPFIDQAQATRLLADLVNLVQPKSGRMTAPDTIRLEW